MDDRQYCICWSNDRESRRGLAKYSKEKAERLAKWFNDNTGTLDGGTKYWVEEARVATVDRWWILAGLRSGQVAHIPMIRK